MLKIDKECCTFNSSKLILENFFILEICTSLYKNTSTFVTQQKCKKEQNNNYYKIITEKLKIYIYNTNLSKN